MSFEFVYAIEISKIENHELPIVNDNNTFYNLHFKFIDQLNNNNDNIKLNEYKKKLINMNLDESLYKIIILKSNYNYEKLNYIDNNDGLHLFATNNSNKNIIILKWGNVPFSKSGKYVVAGVFNNFNGILKTDVNDSLILNNTSFKYLFLNCQIHTHFGNISNGI